MRVVVVKRRIIVMALAAILALSLAAPIAYAKAHHKHQASPSNLNASQSTSPNANQNPKVLPPQSGKYAPLSAQWWQWAFSITADKNPLLNATDSTGKQCQEGQSGNVWFLGGIFSPVGGPPALGTVNRTCEVPAGTQLFIPVINGECSTVEGNPPPGDSLTNCAKIITDQALNGGSMYATVDGKSINDLSNYRVASKPFTFTLPQNNVDGFCGPDFNQQCPPGPSAAAADGVYLLLTPLTPGTHTITFGGKFFPQPDGSFGFPLDVTYTINVVKGR